MKVTLNEILEELRVLYNDIEENDGEITEEESAKLIITKENLDIKLEAYLAVIGVSESDIKLIDEETKRLALLKKQTEKKIEQLKANVLIAVKEFGERKLTPKGNISYSHKIGKIGKTIYVKPTEAVVIYPEFNNPEYTDYEIKGKFTLSDIGSLFKTRTDFALVPHPRKTEIKEAIEKDYLKKGIDNVDIDLNYNVSSK